ncbi:hypothetical protein DM02DRAFT_611646 [Periconia macrospinosa]|uniref:AB hydrolase-1 domain-containing protein n=1 Tax=Periconia macrospinosa TaxID=97972 RepID=A0A2V1E419_9PLEO|nr:hypothetical protein DM02DRAFT_611646 [Periconia macrospinosa]
MLVLEKLTKTTINLPQGGQVTAICNKSAEGGSLICRTLMIGLHGGSYDSSYFAAHDSASPFEICDKFRMPMIAIDRPSYGQSTAVAPLEETNETFMKSQARYITETILPAVWSCFKDRLGTVRLIIYGHGIGAAIAAMVASNYSRLVETSAIMYPLDGIILSSVAGKAALSVADEEAPSNVDGAPTGFPLDVKNMVMLNGPGFDFASADMLQLSATLDRPMPSAEFYDITWQWPTYWKSYFADIGVHVLHIIEEGGPMWKGSREMQEAFVIELNRTGSGKGEVTTHLVKHAPHCIELSHAAPEAVLAAIGWAMALERLGKA